MCKGVKIPFCMFRGELCARAGLEELGRGVSGCGPFPLKPVKLIRTQGKVPENLCGLSGVVLAENVFFKLYTALKAKESPAGRGDLRGLYIKNYAKSA